MKIIYDDIWNSDADIIMVTSNSFIKKDGRLVMGRGAASEMKNKIPNIDKMFGDVIKTRKEHNYDVNGGHLGKYGVIIFSPGFNIVKRIEFIPGLFQVKYHFKDKADLDLISFSTEKLIFYINFYRDVFNMEETFAINFPGIGFGYLNKEDVLPIIEKLPDNVRIYMK